MEFYCNNKYLGTYPTFQISILQHLGFSSEDVYYTHNGHITDPKTIKSGPIHIVPRLPGGKGGFGSMLRAIGAQIEKTTNREACRDLSGRRLRDINEEKRLQNWIDQQAEREKEAADRKQKKLERLCEKPKHVFKDDSYQKERDQLPDRVESAVEQGMMAAAGTSNTTKRKADDDGEKKKKRKKIWMEDDMSDLSSSNSEDDKDEELSEADCSEADIKLNSPIHKAEEKVNEVKQIEELKSVTVKN